MNTVFLLSGETSSRETGTFTKSSPSREGFQQLKLASFLLSKEQSIPRTVTPLFWGIVILCPGSELGRLSQRPANRRLLDFISYDYPAP
jgi:hypothetical protein